MRIAVASTGPSMDSMISPSCTETTHFVFMNLASGEHYIFEKPKYSSSQSKEMPIAESLLGSGIHAVLLQNCKPEVKRKLQTGGIRVYTHISGTVSEAIEQYKEGRLKEDMEPVYVLQASIKQDDRIVARGIGRFIHKTDIAEYGEAPW